MVSKTWSRNKNLRALHRPMWRNCKAWTTDSAVDTPRRDRNGDRLRNRACASAQTISDEPASKKGFWVAAESPYRAQPDVAYDTGNSAAWFINQPGGQSFICRK